MKRPILIALAVAYCTFGTGCASWTPAKVTKREVVVSGSNEKLSQPLAVKVTFANAKDEDLRADVEKLLAEKLASAKIAVAPTAERPVTLEVTNVRRVSLGKRLVTGIFGGDAKAEGRLILPSGEVVALGGRGGASLLAGNLANTTDAALEQLADIVAKEIKARI